MSRWIAMHCCEEAEALQAKHPNAFLLLCQIARRARYSDCPITGLKVGQAFIGDWKLAGIPSEMAYRVAKKRLIDCQLATFQGTSKGTVATLESSTIFSFSAVADNEQDNRPATDKQRTNNRQGTTNHKDNKDNREHHDHNPPNPHGGDSPNEEAENEMFPEGSSKPTDRCIPANWRKLTATELQRIKVSRNSPLMEKLGSWFGRRTGTLWTVGEAVALMQVNPSPEQVIEMGDFYTLELEKNGYRKKALITLLNNWNTELDRARGFFAENPNMKAS